MKIASTFSDFLENQNLLSKEVPVSADFSDLGVKTDFSKLIVSSPDLKTLDTISEEKQMKKNTLVLDLQKTLVYGQTGSFENHTHIFTTKKRGKTKKYFIVARPGLQRFLEEMKSHFNLILFTTKSEAYAKETLETLKISEFFSQIYSRGDCKDIEGAKAFKDLKSIGSPLKNIILLDNCEFHTYLHSFNSVKITPFTGDPSDNELARVASFLETLWTFNDVRPVAKRWERYLNGMPLWPDASLEVKKKKKRISGK